MPKYISTDYVPKDVDYLTAGKRYELITIMEDNYHEIYGGTIINDEGVEMEIHIPASSHLNERPWSVHEEEE